MAELYDKCRERAAMGWEPHHVTKAGAVMRRYTAIFFYIGKHPKLFLNFFSFSRICVDHGRDATDCEAVAPPHTADLEFGANFQRAEIFFFLSKETPLGGCHIGNLLESTNIFDTYKMRRHCHLVCTFNGTVPRKSVRVFDMGW
jgi:hypothetical protein